MSPTELEQVGGRRSGPSTMAALEDLLNNTLDPGYRAAAVRRRSTSGWDRLLVWTACGAVGLLLAMSYQQTHRGAPAAEVARQDLISRIRAVQASGDALDTTAQQLSDDVAQLRDRQLAGSSPIDLTQLEVASGTVAVSGPGISVALGEPEQATQSADPARPGRTPQATVAVLHDTDIRAVVNQLWSAGAEAISVNGIRLTTNSAIRFAGEAVLVDFRQINAPYTIEAVGSKDGLLTSFADSSIARKLKTEQAVYGIAFSFQGKSKLTLSSVTVSEPRFAELGAGPPSSQAKPSTPRPTESPK